MKSAGVMATLVVLALALFVTSPAGMAQDDPDTMAPPDQDVPVVPCVQPADVAPDVDAGGTDAAPQCTPVPASDATPSDGTGGDSMSVPTDTPMPVSTSTPPAMDTPQPVVPTDTPTLLPPPPTDTPTPTSAAKDVPIGTLSRQLPFANPEDNNDCGFDLQNKSNPLSCSPRTFPALFTINFSPFSSDAPITIQVDVGKPQMISGQTWDFLSVPGGYGPSNHKLTASENYGGMQLNGKLTLPVQKASSPHVLVYPRHLLPGSGGKIYLAGFPPDTVLPLGVYRESPGCNAFGLGNQCYELSRELGTLKTNNDGTAVREFSIPANETPTAFLVATPNLKINLDDATDSLLALGRPWFVVDQP